MAAQKSLIDAQTGQKFESSDLSAGSATASNIVGFIGLELNANITLTSGALSATETLLSGVFAPGPIPVIIGSPNAAGIIVDVGLQVQLSAAAAESDTVLTVAINWGASVKETSQNANFRWRTAISQSYQLVRVWAQTPAVASTLQIIFTADTIPATETFDILQAQTRFWILTTNGLYGSSE